MSQGQNKGKQPGLCSLFSKSSLEEQPAGEIVGKLKNLPWQGAKSQTGHEKSPKCTLKKGKLHWCGTCSLAHCPWAFQLSQECKMKTHSVSSVPFSLYVPPAKWDRNFSQIRRSHWTNELLDLGSEGLFLGPIQCYFYFHTGLFLGPVKGYFYFHTGLLLFPKGRNEAAPQCFLSNYHVLAWFKATQWHKHLHFSWFAIFAPLRDKNSMLLDLSAVWNCISRLLLWGVCAWPAPCSADILLGLVHTDIKHLQ